jgi:hypothetical protein
MTKLFALSLVFVGFAGISAHALAVHGYLGLFETLLATPAGIQVTLDLAIAVALALVWMRQDAKERGLPFWRYAVVSVFLGSFGPLAYLIHRELRVRAPREATA